MSKSPKKSKKKNQIKSTSKKQVIKNSFLTQRWQDCLLIGIVTLMAFSPMLQNDFVSFDDKKLIFENPIVQNGDIGTAFTYSLNTPYYKPVVFISWIIEKAVFGFNPVVFHFNNLLIHIINCILIYLLGFKICRFWDFLKPFQAQISFFSAFLFALHPMHVESVAWAVERKDVLYSLFYLISLLSYIKFTEKKSIKWILLCTGCSLLSIMSKGPGITLIGVLFAYDFLSKRELKLNLILEKIPVIVVFFIGVWMYGLLDNFGMSTAEMTSNEAISGTQLPQNTDPISGFLYMNFKMLFWLAHSIIPIKLSIVYPRVELLEHAASFKYIYLVITLALIYGLWKSLVHNRFFIFVFAFFIITLAAPLVRNDLGTGIFLSDRYAYLPSYSIIIFIIISILWIGEKYFKGIKNFSFIGVSIIGILYFLSSFQSVKVWKNTETLWTNAIEKFPNISYGYTSRGVHYLDNNMTNKALKDLEKAVSIIKSSNVSDVEWKRAHLARSRAYRKVGKTNEALAALNKLINRFPNYSKAYVNRGNIYTDLKQSQKAIIDYTKALQENPNDLNALVGRGAVYGIIGKRKEGLDDLNKATSINPNHHDAIRAKIIVYYHSGQLELALENCDRFLKLVPNNQEVINNKTAIMKQLGR